MQFFFITFIAQDEPPRYSPSLSHTHMRGRNEKWRMKWNEISPRDAMRKMNFVVDWTLHRVRHMCFDLSKIINKTGSERQSHSILHSISRLGWTWVETRHWESFWVLYPSTKIQKWARSGRRNTLSIKLVLKCSAESESVCWAGMQRRTRQSERECMVLRWECFRFQFVFSLSLF